MADSNLYQTISEDVDLLMGEQPTPGGITRRTDMPQKQSEKQLAMRITITVLVSVAVTLLVVFSVLALAAIVTAVVWSQVGGVFLDEGGNTQLYLAIVGDYGRQGKFNQKEVAQQMSDFCGKKTFRYQNGKPVKDVKGRCDLIIGVGDNFYDNGVSSLDDPLFMESFENVYRLPGLHSTRMFQILGNHDYRQRTDLQVAYTLRGYRDENSPQYNDRWYMPSLYYSEVVTIGGGNGELDPELRVLLVFMDTSPMIDKYYTDESTNKTALQEADVPGQVEWVEQTLDRHPIRKEGDVNHSPLAVDYKLVIGHHPMYSCGDHLNNPEVIQFFEKMFLEKNVLTYIAGHDHNLMYIQKEGENLHHLISGAGSATRPIVENCQSPMKFGTDHSGFMFVRLNKRRLNVDMVDYEGTVLENYAIENPFRLPGKG